MRNVESVPKNDGKSTFPSSLGKETDASFSEIIMITGTTGRSFLSTFFPDGRLALASRMFSQKIDRKLNAFKQFVSHNLTKVPHSLRSHNPNMVSCFFDEFFPSSQVFIEVSN